MLTVLALASVVLLGIGNEKKTTTHQVKQISLTFLDIFMKFLMNSVMGLKVNEGL